MIGIVNEEEDTQKHTEEENRWVKYFPTNIHFRLNELRIYKAHIHKSTLLALAVLF